MYVCEEVRGREGGGSVRERETEERVEERVGERGTGEREKETKE